jgi:hypothetical protein
MKTFLFIILVAALQAVSLIGAFSLGARCALRSDPTMLPELSDEEYTRVVYQALLGRSPDPQALQLRPLGITRWSMLYWIVTSEEFRTRRLPELRKDTR